MHIEKTKLINDNDKNRPSGRSEVLSVINPLLKPQALVDVPDGNQPVPLGSGVVTRVLGHGGMANVYEIWNSQLEIHKAVKLMHPSAGKDCLERFQTEIKICAKLSHPNIVEIHSVGEWHGLPYIEMERLEGITLENLLNRRGTLSPSEVIAAGILICRGLDFAHNHEYQLYGKNYHGVVHRDLKPGNIMFCLDGQVKIMDFGIARPLDASLHTVDGGVVGTLQYLSPEQLDVGNLDVRTDIYALGELLYESLCGKQAFPEKNITALLNDKAKNRYVPVSDFHTGAPRELIQLIHKSMSREREARISSAKEFGHALKKIGDKLGITDPQNVICNILQTTVQKKDLQSHKSAFKLPVIVTSFVLLITAIITVWLLQRNDSDPSHKTTGITDTITYIKKQPVSSPTISTSEIASSSIPKNDSVIKQDQLISGNIVTNTENRTFPAKKKNNRNVIASQPLISQKLPSTVKASDIGSSPSQRQRSTIELLQEELGITDLQSLIGALFSKERYQDVLTVFNELSPEAAKIPKTAVLALRSQIAIGNAAAISRFLNNHSINDAEFYLAQARQALDEGKVGQSEKLITLAESAPKSLMTYDNLNCETSFLRALNATSIFNNKPDEKTYMTALDKWRNLRAALASNTNHKYLQVEKEERKRMGQIYASLRDGH
jgi:serine/threonine protein kinase